MKRLLTYLGLLATLLAMPYHAKADNMWLHFWDGYSGDYEMGGTGDNTWAYSFYTENCTGRTVGVLPKANNNNNDYMKASQETYLGNGSSVDCKKGNNENVFIDLPSDYNKKNYKVTISATEYNSSEKKIKLTVKWEAVDATKLTLRTNAYDWAAVRYDEYDSANDTYIWDLTSLSDFKNGSLFKLELADRWYGNGGTIGDSWSTLTSTGDNSSATIPTTTGNNIARLEAKYDNGWKVQIVSGNAIVKHDYYWVSPQITNGEMWPAFKMVASRNRYYSGEKVIGDGKISNKYYTFTIKDDDLVRWRTKSKIDNGDPIQWYILRDDGQVVYRPVDKLAPEYLPNGGNKYDDDHKISGQLDNYVSYINFWNGNGYGGADAYMTTDASRSGWWAFKKGSAKAHTFNLNAEKGHVLYNYTTAGASDASGYKLAGNWDAGRKVKIEISNAKTMTPYYYYNHGKVSTSLDDVLDAVSNVSECDSIVYKVSVDRPAAGWGGLYLDVLPASNADWSHAIRPLITLGNNLDGRALHGAMTTASSDQSLNPEASPNYLGYTFSFNATTMTYRLEFHTPDATLSPGTMDGNLNFLNSTSETIKVKFSNASDNIHTTATKYQIAFGDNADITLSDDTKYTASSFKLRYDGTNIYKDDDTTTPVATGKTVFVKIKGWDDDNNYGDVHTYQYTFYSPLTFEPKGGLFINSAKIKIQGGAKPYKWKVYKYETKKDEVSGDDVLDLHTVRSSGTFDGDYNDTDGNYRISTPGILVIEDKNGNKVISDEKNLFDFTYSTSENYKTALTSTETKPNGDDYYRVMPTDYTWKVGKTWNNLDPIAGSQEESWQVTSGKHWSGDPNIFYLHMRRNEAYQTVTDLPAGTYTVQAIVRGGGVPVYLKLNDEQVASINLTSDADDAKTTINKFGRSEQLVEESLVTGHGWHKLEGTVTLATVGNLKIAVRTDYNATGGSVDLADVYLLKDANTDGNYWTTAPTSETYTEYDMSNRSKYNAFSFFDRGANLNSIIMADQKTVIGMSEDNEPYLTGAEKGARRHPCNVVTSSDGGTTWHTPMLALTDYASVIVGSENKYGGNPLVSQHAYGTSFAYTADKFSYDRATSAKMMSTMLPFALTRSQIESMLGSGVKTYIYGGANKTTYKVTFSETSGELAANTPFFFRPEKANTSMVLNQPVSVPATPAAAALAEGIVGTYKHISNVGTTYTDFIPYFYQDNKFVWAANDANAKPFRVIFLLNKGGNNARMLNAIFVDDTTTGIDGITENIQQDAPVYSIDGKLVSSDGDTSRLSKGVYVKAGKKFIIK